MPKTDKIRPRPSAPGDRGRSIAPWGLLILGLALVAAYLGARLEGETGRRSELARFERAQAAPAGSPATLKRSPHDSGLGDSAPETFGANSVDQSLWSEDRIAGYRESLDHRLEPPLAVLRIPRIALEVPVLPGTDKLTLNRAVGHIPGTALPGQPGNVALAGHRDGFFRGLKDLELGDSLELETLVGTQGFVVTSLTVVTPADVQVLDPTPAPTLTLVTCHPFYFVGKAPRRYIVRAELDRSPNASNSESREWPTRHSLKPESGPARQTKEDRT